MPKVGSDYKQESNHSSMGKQPKTPEVSVILPVYNGEKYLGQAVASIQAQTLRNFEVIIVDDGSKDRSLDIARHYATQDRRIIVMSRGNRGVSVSRNEATIMAKADYIAHIDADDIALPERLGAQVAWLKNSGADVCGAWVRESGTFLPRIRRGPSSDTELKLQLLFSNPFTQSSVMLRKHVAIDNPYDATMAYSEDYDLWTRLASKGYKLTIIPEILLMYRLHDAQVSSKKKDKLNEFARSVREKYYRVLRPDASQEEQYIYSLIIDPARALTVLELQRAAAWFREQAKDKGDAVRKLLLSNWEYVCRKSAIHGRDVYACYQEFGSEFYDKNELPRQMALYILSLFKVKYGGAAYGIFQRCHAILNSIHQRA